AEAGGAVPTSDPRGVANRKVMLFHPKTKSAYVQHRIGGVEEDRLMRMKDKVKRKRFDEYGQHEEAQHSTKA
ncbi:unnamed protein product, partial [Amoebophrya sp. A25]